MEESAFSYFYSPGTYSRDLLSEEKHWSELFIIDYQLVENSSNGTALRYIVFG